MSQPTALLARRATSIASTSARRAFSASTSHQQAAPGEPAPPPHLQTVSGQPSYSTTYPPPPRTDHVPVALQPIPKLEPTHGVLVGRIQLRAYDDHVHALDDFVAFAQRAAHALGIPCTHPKFLPTRTTVITTIRGPFAHAKSKENFWRRTHKRSLSVYDAHDDAVRAWIEYLDRRIMAGVGMRSERIRRLPLGFAEGAVERALKESDERRDAFGRAAAERRRQRDAPAPAIAAGSEAAAAAAETASEQVLSAVESALASSDDAPSVASSPADAAADAPPPSDEPLSRPADEAASVPSDAMPEANFASVSAGPDPDTALSSVDPPATPSSSDSSSDLSNLNSAYDAIEKDVLSESDDMDVYSALEPDLPPLEAEDLEFDIDLSPAPVRAAPTADEAAATMAEQRPLPPAAAQVAPDAKDVEARQTALGPDEAMSADGAAVEIVDADEPVAAAERTETPAPGQGTKV